MQKASLITVVRTKKRGRPKGSTANPSKSVEQAPTLPLKARHSLPLLASLSIPDQMEIDSQEASDDGSDRGGMDWEAGEPFDSTEDWESESEGAFETV